MAVMGRAQWLAIIAGERDRQVKKHGEQLDLPLSRLQNIMTEECGEAATEVNDILEEMDKWELTESLTTEQEQFLTQAFQKLETELVQTAACALKFLEALSQHNYRLA